MSITIEPATIYTREELKEMLGVSSRRLGRAVSDGKLKENKKGRLRFYRGQWILDWLDATSVSKPKKRDLETGFAQKQTPPKRGRPRKQLQPPEDVSNKAEVIAQMQAELKAANERINALCAEKTQNETGTP